MALNSKIGNNTATKTKEDALKAIERKSSQEVESDAQNMPGHANLHTGSRDEYEGEAGRSSPQEVRQLKTDSDFSDVKQRNYAAAKESDISASGPELSFSHASNAGNTQSASSVEKIVPSTETYQQLADAAALSPLGNSASYEVDPAPLASLDNSQGQESASLEQEQQEAELSGQSEINTEPEQVPDDTGSEKNSITFQLPELQLNSVQGEEELTVLLPIQISSEQDLDIGDYSIHILGLPESFSLSAGQKSDEGYWILSVDELDGLSLNPPQHYSGNLSLLVEVRGSDPNQQPFTLSDNMSVSVTGIADVARFNAGDVNGVEDQPVFLNIDAGLVDTDGSESLSIMITGVPGGAALSAGDLNADGTWTLTTEQLPGLYLTPAADSATDFDLSITVESRELNGDTHSSVKTIHIDIEAVADGVSMESNTLSSIEDQIVDLSLQSLLLDKDGSEFISNITINGIPENALLSAGERNEDGNWTLSGEELTGLKLIPADNTDGDFILKIDVTTTEAENGDSTTNELTLPLSISGVADHPVVSVIAANGNEDENLSLSINALLQDSDGSESLHVIISDVPAGAGLSAGLDNGDGSWTLETEQLVGLELTPPAHSNEDFELKVTAVSTESGSGDTATTTTVLPVNLSGVADMPSATVSDTAGPKNMAIPIEIQTQTADRDGSESLSVTISNVPQGMTLSAGSISGGSGSAKLESTLIDIQESYTAKVIFAGETAGYRNSFGWYKVDANSGAIHDVKMIWKNASLQGSGGDLIAGESSRLLEFETGDKIGFFIVGNGYSRNNYAALFDGHYEFRDADGNIASLDSYHPHLWHIAEDGTTTKIQGHEFHTTANASQLGLNPDDMAHVSAIMDLDNASIAFGFEDLYGGGDRDFDDTNFILEIGEENTQAIFQQQGLSASFNEWTLSAAELEGLRLNPTVDYEGSFDLSVEIKSTENDGDSSSLVETIKVTVRPASQPGTDALDIYYFGPGYGNETFVGHDGDDVIHLLEQEHGPVEQITQEGDWTLVLDDGNVAYSKTNNSLEFDSEISGNIVLSDGSELAFEDVTKVEW